MSYGPGAPTSRLLARVRDSQRRQARGLARPTNSFAFAINVKTAKGLGPHYSAHTTAAATELID
jgi:hypothetical protein